MPTPAAADAVSAPLAPRLRVKNSVDILDTQHSDIQASLIYISLQSPY
jgi:hypothetical protein